MKKWNILLVGLVLLTIVFVSCVRADSYHRVRSNDWIAPIIVGTMLGVIISKSNQTPRVHETFKPYPRNKKYRYEEQCLPITERFTDPYGYYHDYSRIECSMIRLPRYN